MYVIRFSKWFLQQQWPLSKTNPDEPVPGRYSFTPYLCGNYPISFVNSSIDHGPKHYSWLVVRWDSLSNNLSPVLWFTSRSCTFHFVIHVFLQPIVLIFRLHCSTTLMQPITAHGVAWSVSLSVTIMSHAKMAETIKMPFWGVDSGRGRPREPCIGSGFRFLHDKGQFSRGKGRPIVKYRHSLP